MGLNPRTLAIRSLISPLKRLYELFVARQSRIPLFAIWVILDVVLVYIALLCTRHDS